MGIFRQPPSPHVGGSQPLESRKLSPDIIAVPVENPPFGLPNPINRILESWKPKALAQQRYNNVTDGLILVNDNPPFGLPVVVEGGGHYIHQRRFEKPKKKKKLKAKVKAEDFTNEELLIYERFLEQLGEDVERVERGEKERRLQGLLLERELWDANRDEVSRVIARIEENKRIRKKRNEDALIVILLGA